tara:strand:- start:1635 stop:1817 length:183 start_codon:yes stop_codon:yes gene_type:complete
MIIFKNELPINHEPSLNYIAKDWADCDIENGERLCWDSAYESAWYALENELEEENLTRRT